MNMNSWWSEKKGQRATQSDIPRRFLSAGGILVRRGSAPG